MFLSVEKSSRLYGTGYLLFLSRATINIFNISTFDQHDRLREEGFLFGATLFFLFSWGFLLLGDLLLHWGGFHRFFHNLCTLLSLDLLGGDFLDDLLDRFLLLEL
jgi:hypothetical protein